MKSELELLCTLSGAAVRSLEEGPIFGSVPRYSILRKPKIQPQKITDFEQISTISEKELKEVLGQFDTNSLVTDLMGVPYPPFDRHIERVV